MTRELRTFIACERAESGISEGFGVVYAVESAAHSLAVNVGDVGLLVLEKLIECDRARAALRAMAEHDAEIDGAAPQKAIAPNVHRVVPVRRRAA